MLSKAKASLITNIVLHDLVVFGVDLRYLMLDGNIPVIVEKCLEEIEKRGMIRPFAVDRLCICSVVLTLFAACLY